MPPGSTGPAAGLSVLLTSDHPFVVELRTARSWSQLLAVFQSLDSEDGNLALFSVSGQRLHHAAELEPCMIAAVEDSEIPIFPMASLEPHLQAIEILASAQTITVSISAHQVHDVWMCLPFHLITALGWDAVSPNFPSADGRNCCFTLTPRPTLVRMPVDLMHGQWRIWFMVAQLEAAMSGNIAEGLQVEVQLVARRLWTGFLPRALTLSRVSAMWQTACARCHLPIERRVFSGPFPCSQDLSLGEIADSPHNCVIRKTGHLLVTVHPEMHGGGAKSESLNWAKTRAASLCLAHGLT